jgi:hypothetical protein
MTRDIDPISDVTAAAESVVIGREPAITLADAIWIRKNSGNETPDAAGTPEVRDS